MDCGSWASAVQHGVSSFTYDAYNRLTQTKDDVWTSGTAPTSPLSQFDYTYDAASNLIKEEYLKVDGSAGNRFAYDAYHRLTKAWMGVDSTTMASSSDPTGFSSSAMKEQILYELDGANNRGKVESEMAAGTLDTTYTPQGALPQGPSNRYDTIDTSSGGPVTQVYDERGNHIFDGTFWYRYDYRNRLQEVWRIEESSSMAMQSQSAMSSAADGTDSTQASRGRPKFALVNRDGPPQAIRTVFNSVPNLVQRAVSESKSQAFRNKLRANIPGGVLRMDAPVRSGGMMGPQVEAATLVLTQAYIYDSYNRRTLTIPFETPEASQFHTYDGWRQAGQYYWGLQGTDAVAVPNKQFVWGSRLDELISYRRWNPDLSTPAWENYFVLHGGQDTAAKLVSDAGTLVEQYEYDPYGKASVYVGSSTTPTEVSSVGLPFLWKGIRLDGETGLLYMRYRYYSAQSGRFLSQDPIGVWGDAVNWGNGYGYVGNNPLNRRDPYGLFYVTLDHRRCIATLRYTLQLFMHGFPDEATKAAWAAAAKAVIERDWNTNTVTLMPPPTLRVSMCCCLWSQEISHPCPGGYRMRVEVTIIVEGTDWSDDNEADVTWLPLGAWRLSSTSGNGATATLDSNDIVPTTGRTQAAISHEFGHMLGLDHPSAGLPGVAPNSAPEYNDPTTGTPSSNIMGVGSDVGPENAGPWLQNLPSGWSAH